jgi:hypothetical protein
MGMTNTSKAIDRAKLVTWALVFVLGVLLVNPIAFKLGALALAHHGVAVGVATGLFAGAFVGFSLTAAAMIRSADLRRLSAAQRSRFMFGLYGAALCFIAGMLVEVVGGAVRSMFAWPVAVLVIIATLVIGARLRQWSLSQTDDWKPHETRNS